MTHGTNYPGANRTAQWRGNGGATMTSLNKLLLHTTESSSWPAYPGFQPTLTFNPWVPRGGRWRQHHPINGSASTLANAGNYKTNRAHVVQIEIVAYCDPAKRASASHISKISGDAYAELGEFLAWLHREWGVPVKAVPDWPAYPASYGAKNKIRFSTAGFDAFAGVCGHMHAPGNDHGDPGNLAVAKILTAAAKILQPTKPAVPPAPPKAPAPAQKPALVGSHPAQHLELRRVMDLQRPTLLQGLQPFADGYLLAQAWQLPHGTTTRPPGAESTVFNRYDADHVYRDRMICVTAGHCSTFATSGPYVWMAWDKYTGSKVAGGRIARVEYRPETITDQAKGITWYDPLSGGDHVYPALDLDHDRIALRVGASFILRDLDNFKQAINKPLAKITADPPGAFQGFGLYGDLMWILSGATDEQATLTEYRWSTGKMIGQHNLTALLRKVGATSYEPEGIWVSRAPKPALHVGARFGSSTKRRFIGYKINDL